ncbi:hypothetical protein A4S05_27950 [Nostoc sp. KVJ20]|nr:hypothetical protein A4S05_27950 [Nostoc sp. KVJ20]
MKELSVIQKTYDCIKWYVPIIERLPKIHKFSLGDRIINQLYDLLEGLIKAKYAKDKLIQLEYKNQTGLSSLVGVSRKVAQLSILFG